MCFDLDPKIKSKLRRQKAMKKRQRDQSEEAKKRRFIKNLKKKMKKTGKKVAQLEKERVSDIIAAMLGE